MPIVTKSQLLDKIRAKLGEDASDDTLSLLEDINDTISDYDSRLSESGDWKAKYEENDASWRKRYRDRFFDGETEDTGPVLPTDEADGTFEENLTYENLFKEVE